MKKRKIDIGRFFESIIVFKTSKDEENIWCYFDTTNCYSYAICAAYDIASLQPGEISESNRPERYTDIELLNNVKADMKRLGIDMRESTLDEVITDDYSWKIAILNCDLDSPKERYDFHFLRQTRDMEWYQKFVDEQFRTNRDNRGRLIEDPAEAKYSYNYHLVGYYVLSKI